MKKRKSSSKRRLHPPSAPRLVAKADLPTRYGRFTIYGFAGRGPEEAIALVHGKLNGRVAPLVRVHSQCLTGDVLTSQRCDCRAQLEIALEALAAEERGLLIYEHQEGRGIGLLNKLRAYELQDRGADTVEANHRLGFDSDLRDYSLPAAILQYFALTSVRLMSNNPEKIEAVEKAGVRVSDRVPVLAAVVDSRQAYLRTKREKMGHLL